jgi:hypothetical protein
MSQDTLRIQRFGGGTFIVAGILFSAASLPLVFLPVPPTTSDGFLSWLTASKPSIFASNELLFFATVFLIPSFVALGRLLNVRNSISAIVGLGIIALALPLLAMIIIAQGRLVDPVFNLDLSVDTLKFAFTIYYGGLHAVLLMVGAALFFLGFAMRPTAFQGYIMVFGYVAGLLQIAGAYPWLTPLAFNVLPPLSLSVWMVLVGLSMLRIRLNSALSSQPAQDMA